MSESRDSLDVVLEGEAKRAVATIASLLGDKKPQEAIQRALGTELYLLEAIKTRHAKVFLEYRNGTKSEVHLL